ncbi:ABC transporter substrate-binding protein [Mesorhizobium sp.]|uniref:ABC transporter substrate-binding protein n=1 Tax=Mesorhizobium sp. TaxID=1871066 RepID=UPI000FE985B5|nr:ABC transporter substrate-binding protein [Mesorhizobium sp.]RWC55242.1 MAG: ABC transporter substrate-binding protein [Mesorhizobium sp.]RWC61905.1 MAG: ABC transporter substrate-binding protein [Mesorhizobium sp.]
MQIIQNRRGFLAGAAAAGASGLLGAPKPAWAEPPPEVTRIRTSVYPKVSDCVTPFYAAEELLRAEGFTEVEFVQPASDAEGLRLVADGQVDIESYDAPIILQLIESGTPLKVLAGLHVGCIELLAGLHVTSVKDLRGRRVGINQLNGLGHVLLRLMAANVGVDTDRDIEWVETSNALELLAEGKIDAFLATPPDPLIARDRKIGHPILVAATDRPWSQYFCCLIYGSADFVSQYPVAAKRALRALLKSVDLCVSDPQAAARRSVEKGFASSYDYALRTLTEARYGVWREYDPADTLTFYALRMKELGMITTSPNEVLAANTDWRFVDELKRELKT